MDNKFRQWLKQTKGVTKSQAETYGKSLGLTYSAIRDNISIVNGYKGRRQWQ